MKCKDCKLATKQTYTFRKSNDTKIIGTIEYYICPLDSDDLYPGDYDCIDIKAYKKLLNKGEY